MSLVQAQQGEPKKKHFFWSAFSLAFFFMTINYETKHLTFHYTTMLILQGIQQIFLLDLYNIVFPVYFNSGDDWKGLKYLKHAVQFYWTAFLFCICLGLDIQISNAVAFRYRIPCTPKLKGICPFLICNPYDIFFCLKYLKNALQTELSYGLCDRENDCVIPHSLRYLKKR